jgi:short-subunit dehydrogenase
MNRIDGKVAVITGGTQGLGAAIAKLFAEAGALGIVIVGRDQKKGETVASEISKTYGIQAKMITAYLEKIEDVQRIIGETDNIFGRVDILVNSAGLTDRGNILDTNPDLFNRMIAVNTRSLGSGVDEERSKLRVGM